MELINNVLHSKYTIPVATGLVGVAGGFAAGYLIGRRHGDVFIIEDSMLDSDSEEIDEEIIIEHLDIEEEVDDSTPVSNTVIEYTDYQAIISNEEYSESSDEEIQEEEEQVVENNIVHMNNDIVEREWNYEAEDKYREEHPTGPYPIHIDEYARNDLGYSQESLTYYAGDDVLADESNTPIYNYKSLTGDLQFGYGSGSPGLAYARNGAIRHEWEIFYNEGSFEQEVQGLELEENYAERDIKHANVPKFKLRE